VAHEYFQRIFRDKPFLVEALDALLAERRRQDKKFPDQAPCISNGKEVRVGKRLEVLVEEVGEVAKNLQEKGEGGHEWIEVAAVAVKMWQLEQLQKTQKNTREPYRETRGEH
jgi:hypothetical protein